VAARGLWRSDSLPQVRVILMARALIELSVMMMHATFADYTRTKFGWDQKATGYGMALSGALSVVVDLGILPMLHRRRILSELPTALGGGVLVAAGLAVIALGSAVRAFLLGLAVLSLGTSLFKSALNTLVMGLARRDEAGTISGAVDAMEAVCRVAAPLGGGLLLEHVSIEGPACCGIVSALVGTWALYEVAPAAHKRALLAGKVYEEGKKRA
jgi:Major Facilitator Superfamily